MNALIGMQLRIADVRKIVDDRQCWLMQSSRLDIINGVKEMKVLLRAAKAARLYYAGCLSPNRSCAASSRPYDAGAIKDKTAI
jgi:hypothetical protein